jgi:hypothetical protein
MGGGEAIKDKPRRESASMARNVIAALDLAAAALRAGNPVPQEAVDLMAEPLVPAWMYRAMDNLGWHLQTLREGTWRQLRARA